MTHATLDEQQARARIQQLFRHALRAGLVNPLLHIVTRHRSSAVVQ